MIEKYVKTLNRNGIEFAFLFAGPFDSTGHLPDYSISRSAQETIKKITDLDPDIKILPWIGGIQNKTVHLDDSAWVHNALKDTKALIKTLGVKGVHVDFEYILPGDEYLDRTIRKEKPGQNDNYGRNVNEFHRQLRTLVPDAFISSVVTATSSGTRPWKRKTSFDELIVLQRYVDQIAFLYYDTGIGDKETFSLNCDELVSDITKLKMEAQGFLFSTLSPLVLLSTDPSFRNIEIFTWSLSRTR